jgi:hypothetical protein
MYPANRKYPELKIRSKSELAKRISGKKFSKEKALLLINDVLANRKCYWHDVKKFSEPDKKKFVRSCKETKLGRLLWLIDKKILAPQDYLVPEFIFGGLSEKDHVQAAHHLLGKQKKRTLLKLDISSFFEQNKHGNVCNFFGYKCRCSPRVSGILADLCCVPGGPKNGNFDTERVLARGFATSTRLALWCNLYPFLRVFWEVNNKLKNNDPRIAIFIDDIGITGSRVSKESMSMLSGRIEKILTKYELPLNKEKTAIVTYLDKNMEHLGLRLGRNKISLGKKSRDNYKKIKKQLKKKTIDLSTKSSLLKKKMSYDNYKKHIRKVNNKLERKNSHLSS